MSLYFTGYYDGSDIARPYLVDYSSGSSVYTHFDNQDGYYPSYHHKRGATSHKDRLWPLGIVPFTVDANFSGRYIQTHINLCYRTVKCVFHRH